jgi:putative ABC transport system substrate-binding protein
MKRRTFISLLGGMAATWPLAARAQQGAMPVIGFLHGASPSYLGQFVDALRIAGRYAGQILKGAKTADLPVQQAVKIELSINLKTAKALGLTVPAQIVARADEVIE